MRLAILLVIFWYSCCFSAYVHKLSQADDPRDITKIMHVEAVERKIKK